MLLCFLYTKRVLFMCFFSSENMCCFSSEKRMGFFSSEFHVFFHCHASIFTFGDVSTPSIVEFLVMVFSTKKLRTIIIIQTQKKQKKKLDTRNFHHLHHLRTKKHTTFSGEIHTQQMGDGPPNLSQMRMTQVLNHQPPGFSSKAVAQQKKNRWSFFG